jgi:cell wall-associated NlpC family hydrolase
MTTPPTWAAKYIGVPYLDKGRTIAGFDCWGLVRHVLTHEFGVIELPDYVDSYTAANDRRSVSVAVQSGLSDGWKQIEKPGPGTLIILKVAGRPWHCAVAVTNDWMLHTLQGVNACLERMDSMVWRNRIEGFYEHC